LSFPSLVVTASSVSSVVEFSTLTFLVVEVASTVVVEEDSVVVLGSGVVVTVPGVDGSVPELVGVSAVSAVGVVSVVGLVVSVAGGVFSSDGEALVVDEVDPTEDAVGVVTGGSKTVLD